MKQIIADHSSNVFLKPGEIIVSSKPVLVSTVLGSCVAITMYSPEKNIGAICHAMLPDNPNNNESLLYVDSAIHHLYRKMIGYGCRADLIIKLFGGAQVLDFSGYDDSRMAVGKLNIQKAVKILKELGLMVYKADIGGTQGRKLFFSIKTGDVYLRKLKISADII